ncbi:MFS transporter [Rhodococcus sp. 2H158]
MGTHITTTTDDPAAAPTTSSRKSRIYPWVVFVLIFGLLLSDYMSRQVLSAVFPFLKEEWALSDSELAALNSVVALMVGLCAIPLSLLADRWGRLKSVILMATIWSAATLMCAVATSYGQMLGARFLIGVGEAAYSSVGLALLLTIFAPGRRSAVSGAFLAGSPIGSVVGVMLGGVIAVHVGWRWSFASLAILGLILVALFRAVVTERRLAEYRYSDPAEAQQTAAQGYRAPLSSLITNPAVLCAYIGGGLLVFTPAVLMAWLPSFFNRYYDMVPDRAGAMAALFILCISVGMPLCGLITDRISRIVPIRKWLVSAIFCLLSAVLLLTGFAAEPGVPQLVMLAAGAFFSNGAFGPVTALVADLTHASLRATALGTAILFYNLLGLALGPMVVGALADRIGLYSALQLSPLMYFAAIVALVVGKRLYPAGTRKLAALDARPTV